MISISIISPLKSMAVIDKSDRTQRLWMCITGTFTKTWKKLKTYTNSVRTSPMCCFSPGNLVTPIL